MAMAADHAAERRCVCARADGGTGSAVVPSKRIRAGGGDRVARAGVGWHGAGVPVDPTERLGRAGSRQGEDRSAGAVAAGGLRAALRTAAAARVETG